MDSNAPLQRLLRSIKHVPPNLADGLKEGDATVLDFLQAKVTLWQLGISIAKLGNIRAVELTRLTINEFWKSQYVLLMGAIFKERGCNVSFVEEGNGATPDLHVDDEFLECKEKNIEEAPQLSVELAGMFRKSKPKFNKQVYQPGVVCFEIDPRFMLTLKNEEREQRMMGLEENVQRELRKMPTVKAAILTIRRIHVRDDNGISSPLQFMTVDNP